MFRIFPPEDVMLASRELKLQKSPIKDLCFFLDFDGSLCPHLEVWEGRSYDPDEIYTVVKSLAGKSSGVYWNTGRRVESLASVLPDYLQFPGYFVQGSMRWDPVTKVAELCGPSLPESIPEFYGKALEAQGMLRLEIKATSLLIAPYQNVNMNELTSFILKHPLPAEHTAGWIWHVGARGAELLSRNYDKAFAIRDAEARLAKTFKPVVIGDDLLDRPAVEEALKRGGYAILVGEHCGWATEIEHMAWQVEFFNQPFEALAFLKSLGD